MKKMRWYFAVILAVLSFLPLGMSAAEQSPEAYKLDAVVVSTTRTEIPVFDAPQSVTVITGKELMASPFERVEDIVRSVPGMYNFRHYSLQTNGIVSPLKMRGVGSNRILVLVDGVPQNDNFNNAIAWVAWGHISKQSIERIEIVRGPTSALYGSEGLGGVIHIITKKPRDERQTSIGVRAGTADTYGGQGFHSRKVKDLGFMVAGGYEESDGFYMVENPEEYEIKRYRKAGKVFGKAVYDLTPSSDLSFSALVYDHETGKGRKFFYDELTIDQYWMKYDHQWDLFDFKGLIYLNRADKTAFQDTAKDNYRSLLRLEQMPCTTWGADVQGTLPVGLQANVTLGLSYKKASWDYDDIYVNILKDVGAEGKQEFISPFANIDLHFLEDSLIMNLGARYDWIETSDGANWDSVGSAGKPAFENSFHNRSEGSFSPKLGITWHLKGKTTLRASGGKGFRAPSLFELYKVHVREGGAYYREANPDLEPEEIWSCDVGAERFLTDNFWGRLTFYRSFAKDYIGDRLTGTGTFGGGKTRYEYELDNISEVDIYGIETELQWYLADELTFFANYTYNISEVRKEDNNPDLEGNYLTNDPMHNAHLGFRYQNRRWANVSLIANYYGHIYFDNENTLKENGYFTWDASVSKKFFERFTSYVNAENIFDEEYPIFRQQGRADTIAPGMIIAGGVKFAF